MPTENRHIERIAGTRSNLQTNLDNLQIAIETDQNENLVYKDDDGTYHVTANQNESNTFENVIATGYIGEGIQNNLTITDESAILKSGNEDIIEYTTAGETVIINKDVEIVGDIKSTSADLDGAVVINESGADVDFRVESDTDANAIFVEGSNGYVGHGTSTPAQKMEISGAAALDGSAPVMLRISDTRNASGWTPAALTQGIEFYQGDGSSPGASVAAQIAMKCLSDTGGARDLFFRVYDSSKALIDAMTIKYNTGNVGIGTTTPAEKLEVNGNAKASALQINADSGTADTDDALYFGGRTTAGSGRLRYNASTQTFYFENRGASTWAVGIMAGLVMATLNRSDDEIWDSAHTEFTTNGAIVAETLTRNNDIYTLANLYSWTASNSWQTILTPTNGESGEVWALFTDTADSDKKRLQIWKWAKAAGTVTFTTSGTAAVVDIGEATIKLKLQDSSGAIQVLHTAGVNRTCACAIRLVRTTA